jgi:ABC-type phosphate/phosphonate transport system substrate-binding protein
MVPCSRSLIVVASFCLLRAGPTCYGEGPLELAPAPPRSPPRTLRVSVRAAEHRPELIELETRALGLVLAAVQPQTGLAVELLPPPASIGEQLRRIEANQADAFVLSPFTYLVARERFGVEPVLAVQKRGHGSLYIQELVAERASGITRVEDLRGRRLVLDVEEHSNPVRYWLTHDLLARAGLIPAGARRGEGLALETHLDPGLNRHRALLEVLEGRADAALSFHAGVDESGRARDGRHFHLARHPDALERLVVVAQTAGVPYPVVALRRGLAGEPARRLAEEVCAFSASAEGLRLSFAEFRPRAEGLGPISDRDFDALRRIVDDYGVDVEAELEHDDDTF